MGILLMQVGGGVEQDAQVLSCRDFHTQFVGSWVPPPPASSLWGPSHACLSLWAPSSSPIVTTSLYPAATGSRGLAHPSPWAGHLGLPSPPPGLCHPEHSTHLCRCGPGHHPSILCLTSITLASGLTLAPRALYMVGFHSFVCTFGEGLLCARPCARQQVNGRGPWECTPRGDAREPADGTEPGPGRLGDVVQRRAGLTAWRWGRSAQVLLSEFCKESLPVPTFFPAGGRHLRAGTGSPGPPSLPAGSLLPGPWPKSSPSGSLGSWHCAPCSLTQPPCCPLCWGSPSPAQILRCWSHISTF